MKMDSIYGFLEKTYNKGIIQLLGFTDKICEINNHNPVPFNTLIHNDEWCLEIIRTNLYFKSKNFKLIKRYAYRFRHIVICWLLGVGLNELLNPETVYDGVFNKEWQLSSYTHDYGYFCDEVFEKPIINLKEHFSEYYLLKDHYSNRNLQCLNGFLSKYPQLLSVSYDDIENYYYKNLEWRKSKRLFEKSDHGIIGACIAFMEYSIFLENQKNIEDGIRIKEINKTACLITAAHNLWNVKIKKECRLLSLMGLVDTIEPTKCFYEMNKKAHFYQITKWENVVKLIKIKLLKRTIVVSLEEIKAFANTRKKGNRQKILSIINDYKGSLLKLPNWTSFEVDDKGDILFIHF